MNISKITKQVHVLNAVAAGTSNQTGTHVDMQGFDGVMFLADIGTLTATQVTSMKAQGGNASNDSDQADISGAATAAMADGDSNKMLILDVFRPQQRYVRPVVLRGTANAVINCVIAILYQADKMPVPADATVSQGATVVGV
jgi:hypothetical protein